MGGVIESLLVSVVSDSKEWLMEISSSLSSGLIAFSGTWFLEVEATGVDAVELEGKDCSADVRDETVGTNFIWLLRKRSSNNRFSLTELFDGFRVFTVVGQPTK